MKGLTLNGEPNIGHPYTSRDRYDEPLPVPYGNADGTHERLMAASPNCRGRTCGAQSRETRRQRPSTQRTKNGKTTKKASRDVHSSDWAQRGRGGAYSRIGRCSGPKKVACQIAGAHGRQWTQRTLQLYWAVTSMPTRLRITAVRVDMRVTE